MRRQFEAKDDQLQSKQYKITSKEGNGFINQSINTDKLIMKDILIGTLIQNSDKQQYGIMVKQQQKYNQIINEKQQINQNNNNNEQQQIQLNRFLRKIKPLIESQLNQNIPIYQNYGKNEKSKFYIESKLIYTLQNIILQQQEYKNLQLSDIAWNSTNIIIIGVYSYLQHFTTCSHKSIICIWKLYQRNFKINKPQILETSNCINCVQFHPIYPSIFVCGNYIGQISIYNLSNHNQQLITKSKIDEYFHKDIIMGLKWWAYRPPGKPETQYNILSLGIDGKILLWQTNNNLFHQDYNIHHNNNNNNNNNNNHHHKSILKYPIKGYLMLRKKQGNIIPVSGLSISQSKLHTNIFIIGSQGGSILRASLTPINHQLNTQGKTILDLQQNGIKFKNNVYPFMLNLLIKNLRQIKNYIEKIYIKKKINIVESVQAIFNTKPQLRNIYSNPINYAYQGLAYPIYSISNNQYEIFVANGCDGYSRIYHEKTRENIESIEQGWQWKWIGQTSKLGGFIAKQWVVLDWLNGHIQWSIPIDQGLTWKQSSVNSIAIICEHCKIKIIQLNPDIYIEDQNRRKKVITKIAQLLNK